MLALYIVIGLIAVLFLIGFIKSRINKKYKDFVLKYSNAIKELNEINRRYSFKHVENLHLRHSYDNQNMYYEISCKDYLIYELVDSKRKIKQAVLDTLENRDKMMLYISEINEKCKFNEFNTSKILKNKDKLEKYEHELFEERRQKPNCSFTIIVSLTLTKINYVYITSKEEVFGPSTIMSLIDLLNKKDGDYYLNENIWNSICKVERGKVSNKLRFTIYERDHYKCRKCGSTHNLEIDHIVPISRGGKTTYDNLQTLCHKCNVEKGRETRKY